MLIYQLIKNCAIFAIFRGFSRKKQNFMKNTKQTVYPKKLKHTYI